MKQSPEEEKKQRREFAKAVSFFSQIAITMAACIFIGVLLGKFLDSFFNTSPWLLLICSLLGVAAAFKSLFDMASMK